MTEKVRKLPPRLFKLGYYAGLIAFFICLLLSLISILAFLYSTYFWVGTINESKEIIDKLEIINARLVMARIALLSCGLLAGLSFGFLGFSLFLIGIDGSSDVSIDQSNYKVTLSRVSPGIIVIIAATILIGFCATRETYFWYERTQESKPPAETKEEKNAENSNGAKLKELPKLKGEQP